jgi:hypothetical protein
MERKFEIINEKWIRIKTDKRFQAVRIDSINSIEADPKIGFIKLLTMYYNNEKHISGLWLQYEEEEKEQYESDLSALKKLLFE